MRLRYLITTANQPGAVGIVQVSGNATVLTRLLNNLSVTPRAAWPTGRLHLIDFAGIDEGLAGMISPTTAQLMPHGGPRVMQKLVTWLRDQGVVAETEVNAASRYPEAASPIEADVLHAIATAASPAAIDRLAAQPALWRRWFAGDRKPPLPNQDSLGHLLHPPTVVVVGRPNVGKSTLLNQLLGRSASVVADLPGTTRDWVGGMVELCPTHSADNPGGESGASSGGTSGGGDPLRDAVAVRWLDTPGIRTSHDAVEQQAIELARALMDDAQVLISMTGADTPWLGASELPRQPDFELYNQFTPAPPTSFEDRLVINAATGEWIDRLTTRVLQHLGLSHISEDVNEPWAFSPTLQQWTAGEEVDISDYLGV